MTDYVRVPREPTPEMLVNGREALLPLIRLDSYGPLIGLWRDMLAASPQGEGSSGDPAPIKPSGDTGELRKRVAKIVDPAGFDDRWDVPGLRHEASLDERVDEALAKADAILDLIQKATTPKAGEGSPIGQNDQPGLAFSDASEP